MTITPEFLFNFESNMQAIVENEYARFGSNLWWSKFMKRRPSSSAKEILAWLLSTSVIGDLGKSGGNLPFDELVSQYVTYENKFAGAGLKLKQSQLKDLDGVGLDAGAKWAADMGEQMAYWPQKKLVELLKAGHGTTLGTAYDGLAFFHASHKVNPTDSASATFANLFTGAASGQQAGAVDISEAVSLDVALQNLGKAIAGVKAIKMPNQEDPRFLRPSHIIVPPKMQARATQLTNAKFMAQAAASGGGSADVEAVIASFGLQQPIVADELVGFESDTTWFLACEQMSESQLGAFVYVDREPFRITYYTGGGGGTGVDANLDRADELEWHCKGRNVAGFGHPFLFFKCKAA